jgi:endonuclease YncB( thermonuclease family)
MQILRTFILTAVAAAQFSQPPARSGSLLVTAVLDGDTIVVATVGRVRLLGIDAPETSHGLDSAAPFAIEAKARLAGLVLRRWIRLEYEGARDDVYGRRLAYVVSEDGTFVNGALVRDGLARISARQPLRRLEELRRAESEAQASRRGMWGGTPQIPVMDDASRTERPTTIKAPKPRARKAPVVRKRTTPKPRKPRKKTTSGMSLVEYIRMVHTYAYEDHLDHQR